MWKYGINYLHGTGHGVGQFMSVHESMDLTQSALMAPHASSPWHDHQYSTSLAIYIEGSHGVRHEDTIMLVVNADFSADHGRQKCLHAIHAMPQRFLRSPSPYYTFEHLTLCPIITTPILTDMLTEVSKRAWFQRLPADCSSVFRRFFDEEQ